MTQDRTASWRGAATRGGAVGQDRAVAGAMATGGAATAPTADRDASVSREGKRAREASRTGHEEQVAELARRIAELAGPGRAGQSGETDGPGEHDQSGESAPGQPDLPDQESVARSVALRSLTGAPRSRAELAGAMARKGVPEEAAERVLDRLTDVGLVDDAAYAEILVRSRHAERGMSRRALAQELRRRGVDEDTAAEALEQVGDEDEETAARALARRKLAGTRGLDRETRLRRTYAMLGRKGYGGSMVARVVREELAAEGADDTATWSGESLG